MPHLSTLSEKDKEKAKFIDVNVWEKKEKQPYETAFPNLTVFVNSSANRTKYDVIIDNNAPRTRKKEADDPKYEGRVFISQLLILKKHSKNIKRLLPLNKRLL